MTADPIQAAKERLAARLKGEYDAIGRDEDIATILAELSRLEEEVASVRDDLNEVGGKWVEARRQIAGYQHHLRECEQIAGKALYYPWFKDDQKNFPGTTEADGVCIGDHVGDTIVAELAEAFIKRGVQIAERDEALKGLRGWMPVSGITPECDHAMRVADALLASPHTGVAEPKPVTMLVDQDWLSRHVTTDPDVSVEAGSDVLVWLSANRNVELSFDYGDADDDGKGWCVHRVNGGVNDREWTLIGTGETPLAALRAALAPQSIGGGDA